MYGSDCAIIETNGVRNCVKSLYKRQLIVKSLLHLSLSMYCFVHSTLHSKTLLKERRDGKKKKKS